MPVSTARKFDVTAYSSLLARVRTALLEGQKRIERAKVETYWQAGKLIHDHILKDKSRSEHYGTHLLQKLAKDLGVHETLLNRTLKFYRSFPKIPAARQESLTWTHYRELMTIGDDETRHSLLSRAEKGEWRSDKQIERIKVEARPGSTGSAKRTAPAQVPKLLPRLGTLYTYRLMREESDVQGDGDLRVDLGFEIRKRLSREEAKGLREGQIIESRRSADGEYSFRKTDRKESDLYTYKAQVLRVVDGDTLYCLIDLGFNTEQRHYLRLRGIDAYEMPKSRRIVPGSRDPGAAAGRRAKAFVAKALEKTPEIVLTSTKKDETDKYGRYLADVWIPRGVDESEWPLLNQVLLDENLAIRIQG